VENITPITSPEFKATVDKYYSVLMELRKKIIITLIFFAFASIGGFLFYEQIIKFLIGLLSLDGINIVFTSPFQFINLAIDCGAASGLILTFPLLIIQVLSFLRPALREREYKLVVRIMPFSLVLFVAGFLFGALIMKWQIEIFLDKSVSLGIGNILDISNLLNTIILTSLLLGIGFQFPIVLLVLMRIGIVKRQHLSKYRLWVYLGSFIFAVLLPADSILADILLTLPLVILFEITLVLDRVLRTKK
jgi:sec-independent protein translocase protein TatC